MPISINKLSRKACIENYTSLPQILKDPSTNKETVYLPEVEDSILLSAPAETPEEACVVIAEELSAFLSFLKKDRFIFMGDTDYPWLAQNSMVPEVVAAKKFFAIQNIGVRFMGGLEVHKTELLQFIPPFFSLVKHLTALPNIYFVDPKQQFLLKLNRKGELIVMARDKEALKTIKDFIKSSKLEVIK